MKRTPITHRRPDHRDAPETSRKILFVVNSPCFGASWEHTAQAAYAYARPGFTPPEDTQRGRHRSVAAPEKPDGRRPVRRLPPQSAPVGGTARHQVNHAQVERGRQAREDFERTSPIAPAIRQIDRSVEFLDLVTACHAFVAASGRVVPGLRGRQLSDNEKVIIHENVARVRATLDWIETAVDTGKVDVDGELARLLQGE